MALPAHSGESSANDAKRRGSWNSAAAPCLCASRARHHGGPVTVSVTQTATMLPGTSVETCTGIVGSLK